MDQDAIPELWASSGFGDQIRIFSLAYTTGALLNAPPFSPGSISVSPFQSEVVMQARQLLVGDLDGLGGLDMVTLNAPQLALPFATLSIILSP